MQRKTRELTALSLLFALALILSFLEGLLPPVPFLPPGVKPGLSNIVTMYCLLYLGAGPAFLLAFLKAGFALVTRGIMAGLLSGCGGLLSVTVMLLVMLPKKHRASVFLLSACGAVSHNIGQLIVAAGMVGGFAAMAYLPVLLLSGAVMGTVTGFVLRAVLPAIGRLRGIKDQTGAPSH